jgi:hypothetical protein
VRLTRACGAAALNPELMRDITRRLRRKFLQQRTNARNRGIDFRLTFEEWRDWWLATGHVDERGRLRGQWVMARPGDRGAYELGNIICLRAEENVSVGNATRTHVRATLHRSVQRRSAWIT